MSVNQRMQARDDGPIELMLGEAELARRKHLKTLFQVACGGVAAVLAAGWLLGGALPVMLGFAAIGLWILLLVDARRTYASVYKRLVIPRLVREIDPQLRYDPTGGISAATFADSLYAPGVCSHFMAEDLIEGEVAGRRRRICEVRASQGSGKSQREVFRGLFSETTLDVGLKGHVVVVPDTAERLFGSLGTKLQALRCDRGKLVHFEDPAFEKAFVVYAEHEREARQLLTKDLRKQLLALRAQQGHDIGFTVCEDKAYVLVHCPDDHFEPALLQSAIDERPLGRFRRDLATVLDVFEALPLRGLA